MSYLADFDFSKKLVIGESKDLSKSQLELTSSMESELLRRLNATGADLPEVNPNNPPKIRRGGGGRNRANREAHDGGQNLDQQNKNQV